MSAITFSMDITQLGETSNQEPGSFEATFLDPKSIHFKHDGNNLTYTAADGTSFPRVTLRRSFPLSADTKYIVVRVPEEEPDRSHEIGVIEDFLELDDESRSSVEAELRSFYLVPTLQRIQSIREEFGFLYWMVDTDRGPKSFVMRDSIIGQVRQVGPGRWLIIDINQTRYEIHNFEQLDELSQDLIERYLLL
jgi:uncharacterized protein YecE (DUF72 family)